MKTLLALMLLLAQSPQPRPCPATRVDVNNASKAQLMELEGISPEIADAIIKGRPYKSINQVQQTMPKSVWEKNVFKACLNGVIVIPGNRMERTLQLPK